jgi:hypothetical protein
MQQVLSGLVWEGVSGDSEEGNAQPASLCHSRGTQERGISGARSGPAATPSQNVDGRRTPEIGDWD